MGKRLSAAVANLVTERAELATDEYLPLTSLIEGVVLLRKNPDFVPETVEAPKKK